MSTRSSSDDDESVVMTFLLPRSDWSKAGAKGLKHRFAPKDEYRYEYIYVISS